MGFNSAFKGLIGNNVTILVAGNPLLPLDRIESLYSSYSSRCIFNDALFKADGIVKRELVRVDARHGSTSCQDVTLLVLVCKVASSSLAIGMHVCV